MPATKAKLFNEPELVIYTEPEHQLMVVQANGVVPSGVYRRGMRIAIDEAINKQLKYWLVNNKAGGIISPADQIWANEVVMPQLAHKSALVKMALIEPADVLSQLILEGMMDEARHITPFEMQFFDRLKDAYMWFRETGMPSK
ncbi:hypothetical protein [Pontibacter litorisediminis]|uniref:hypothetical protein n=1 Tax=Pontibacter litorisediminis TaxID=1846260 RepID=UPI0023EC7823|nr:hypothetical protein [Pontibacter litorisediminis]